jgi:hypothetical protein
MIGDPLREADPKARAIYKKVDGLILQDFRDDPVDWNTGQVKPEFKVKIAPIEEWAKDFAEGRVGKYYIGQWEKDFVARWKKYKQDAPWDKDFPPVPTEEKMRNEALANLQNAYRAAIFLKQMRQGDLKELLVPLITQVLKENTK